ncbi:hypothetical protein [Acetivibrio cellulolyticus]|uniref:hypothetical protein n=1 Tax=Acetivibrio cellulolyticus TaxID=35830 RepID=UPI0001E2C28A|nr:hypothetical protein [Acetivibrio cellulolyticus]
MIKYLKNLFSGVLEKTLVVIISTAVLSGALLVFFGKYIFAFIKLIPSFILKFLTFGIPVWIILVVLLILFVVLKVYIAYQDSIFKAKSFLQYREDVFDSLIYKWNYFEDYGGKYDITEVRVFCPHCKCQMIYDGYILKCINCGLIHNKDLKTENEIKILIYHKLNTKEYLNRIKTTK